MNSNRRYDAALDPQQLAKFFVERANAGDVDGLVALYEPDAALALGDGQIAVGSEAIRQFYAAMLESRPQFSPGQQRRALRSGDLALTSTLLTNGSVTAEVARRQSDGTWLWSVDQPSIGK
jgi:ketosteroid isomerase-like protein